MPTFWDNLNDIGINMIIFWMLNPKILSIVDAFISSRMITIQMVLMDIFFAHRDIPPNSFLTTPL